MKKRTRQIGVETYVKLGKTRRHRINQVSTCMKCQWTFDSRASVYVSLYRWDMNGRFNTNKTLGKKRERSISVLQLIVRNKPFEHERNNSTHESCQCSYGVDVNIVLRNVIWIIRNIFGKKCTYNSSWRGAGTLHTVVDTKCVKWLNAVFDVYFSGFWDGMVFSGFRDVLICLCLYVFC